MFSPSNENSKLQSVRWMLNAVFLLTLIIFGFLAQSYWLASLRSDRIEVGKAIHDVRLKLGQAEEIAREHDRIVKLKTAIEERAESIKDRIPDQPNEGEFLRQTTSAAKECGITITEYRRRGIEDHDDHSRLVIFMSLKGTFENVCRFMHQLEQLPRISKVSQLKLENNVKDGVYPMELTLILFFRPEQPAARMARVFK